MNLSTFLHELIQFHIGPMFMTCKFYIFSPFITPMFDVSVYCMYNIAVFIIFLHS